MSAALALHALATLACAQQLESDAAARCRTPCEYLAAYSFGDVVERFREDECGEWPVVEPGQCDRLESMRSCVVTHADDLLDDPAWAAALLPADYHLVADVGGAVRAGVRAAQRVVARDNATRLTELVSECRASAHPTAGPVAIDRAQRSVSFGPRSYRFPRALDAALARVFDLGTERVVVPLREADPVGEVVVYAVRGGKLVALGRVAAVDFGRQPNLPGDGTLRGQYENRALDGIAVTYRLGRRAITRRERVIPGYVCSDCTACPFVFQQRADRLELVGEVLRNLVGAAAETTDDLVIEVGPDDAAVTLELVELKPETTSLDAIGLALDGADVPLIAPEECAAGGPACDDDGIFDTFAEGARRTFTFALPAPHGTRARVVANGFYVPFADPVRDVAHDVGVRDARERRVGAGHHEVMWLFSQTAARSPRASTR